MVSLSGEAGLEVVEVGLQDKEVGSEVAVANLFQDKFVPATGDGDHEVRGDDALEVEGNGD